MFFVIDSIVSNFGVIEDFSYITDEFFFEQCVYFIGPEPLLKINS